MQSKGKRVRTLQFVLLHIQSVYSNSIQIQYTNIRRSNNLTDTMEIFKDNFFGYIIYNKQI